MKNLSTFLTAFFLLISLHAQQTYVTSGNSADWSSPQAWKLENGDAASQVPGSNDHVIIRDYLSLELEETYTHRGNMSIMGNGIMQISNVPGNQGGFVFGGKEMNVYGYLISSSSFSQVEAPTGKRGLIILHETATMSYSANFSLQGGLILESSACGATKIEGDFILQNSDAFICGEGNIMVGGKLRAFATAEQEVSEAEIDNFFAESSCEQIVFHNDLEDCDQSQARLSGSSSENDFLSVAKIEVKENGTAVNISWESEASSLVKSFTVERSIDGSLFEAISTIEEIENETFEVLDTNPVQVKSYYRIRQVLGSGQTSYSEVKVYDPTKDIFAATQLSIFPNNLSEGESIRLETSRLQDISTASIDIRNMNGQRMNQQVLPVASNGKIYADIQMNMKPGLYFLVMKVGNEVISKRIQIR